MIIDKNIKCCGCSACSIICPTKYLTMSLSVEGFNIPIVEGDKCIDCDLCEKVCPILDRVNNNNNKDIKAFSFATNNKNNLENCTSGGIAYEISKVLVEDGYKICGVKYNYKLDIAEHYIANSVAELSEMKGSKYIQSDTYSAFKSLFDGNKYLVIGAPCQIAGIKEIVQFKKLSDKFIFIDFFCHGTPSSYIWKNYLKYTKNKNKINSIEKINFRDKQYGWHNFTIGIKSNIKEVYSDKDKDKDLFYQFFLGNHALNKCCYECKFRLDKSDADLRIGDLWGNKYSYDKKGVSGILTFTEVGKVLVDKVKMIGACNIESIDDVIEGQMHNSIKVPNYRKKLLNDMKLGKNMRFLYLKYIVSYKVKRKIIKVIKGSN